MRTAKGRPAGTVVGRVRRRWRGLGAGLAEALAASLAAAQVAPPPPAPTTPRVVPTPAELAPPIAPPTAPAELPLRPPPRELAKPQDEITLDVKAYAVPDDAPAALKAALPALTAPYVGPGRGYEDLVNAAAEVTRFLQRDLGYYLGYAYLPEQSPADGVVRIAVLEGRLDRITLNWRDDLPVRREVVEAYLARLKPGDILRVRDVERVVFLVNDLRGMTARFEVKAGSVPGTAALVVTPAPESRWSGKVDVDLNGSRFLGRERVGAVANMASPFGRGDGLTLTGLGSAGGGLYFALLGYTTPVGADGLKLGASLSTVRYKLDDSEFPLGLSGDAVTMTAYGLYPWVRSRNLNLFVLGSLEHKRYTDRQDVGNGAATKSTDSLSAGLTGDFRDDVLTGGVNTYELSLVSGRLRYDGDPPPQRDPASYYKLAGAFTRLQNVVDGRFLLYTALRAQWAGRNLDTTEQFRIGGPDGVRAFAPGEGTADTGYQLSLEARFLPPESWFGRFSRELVFAAFFDYAQVRYRHDASEQGSEFVNRGTFGGPGLSLVWSRPNEYGFRTTLAWPTIGKGVSDPRERSPRLYMQFTKQFN